MAPAVSSVGNSEGSAGGYVTPPIQTMGVHVFNTPDSVLDLILFEWAQARIITMPVSPKIAISASPIKAPKGTSIKLLGNDREENF